MLNLKKFDKILNFVVNEIKKWLSYVWPFTLKSWNSEYSGRVELILVNGKKVLNTRHANYSFDSLHRVFQYMLRYHMPRIEPEDKILLLGLGGGSVPYIFRKELKIPNPITAIEIDPLMISIAREEFGINQLENITIIQADAADYVKHCAESYACILLDVFIDDRVPESVQSFGFMKELKRIINPGGRIFINTIQRDTRHNQHESAMYRVLTELGFEVQIEEVDQVNFVWMADLGME